MLLIVTARLGLSQTDAHHFLAREDLSQHLPPLALIPDRIPGQILDSLVQAY